MLVLLFLYMGILALHDAYDNKDSAARACAVLALVGTVNIPIIYKSVDWWYSLHQPATIKFTEAPSMDASMWQPLLLMILGFYCFYGAVLLSNLRSEILEREERTAWVGQLQQERDCSFKA